MKLYFFKRRKGRDLDILTWYSEKEEWGAVGA